MMSKTIVIHYNLVDKAGKGITLLYQNISNEWYARDTSKKIKSVFKAKGNSGKHVSSCPPYGYLKSAEDKNKWIVDEEAAEVVRRIFRMTVEGKGPYQISQILQKEKVDILNLQNPKAVSTTEVIRQEALMNSRQFMREFPQG